MAESIACVAPDTRLARRAAREIAPRLPGIAIWACSLRRYAAAAGAPARIVLAPAGRVLSEDLRFLERVERRILWPAPAGDFRDAIGGIRSGHANPGPRRLSRKRDPRTAPGKLAAALLLEGRVDAARARAALVSSAPIDWVVESARHVQIEDSIFALLARAGIRWSALEPVEVAALYASPALARARGRWKGLVPKGTGVWVRGS